MKATKRLILMILDGWGHGKIKEADAIQQAKTPFVDSLYENYPHAELLTFGEEVGLPEGQMGNSEVGHLNIGAGRIVFQELLRINNIIRDDVLKENETLVQAIKYAKEHQKAVHLMGLVSDGGVHSHIQHLIALCHIFDDAGIEDIFIHAFLDGRDTDPEGGLGYLQTLDAGIFDTRAQLATVIGRYYAMDRDKRWERIKKAYDLLVHGKGKGVEDLVEGVDKAYEEGITDEFMEALFKVDEQGEPTATIGEGDVVLCFNFRTDRCRQITEVLTQSDMPDQGMKTIPLHYVTMTNYDDSFEGVHILFEKENVKETLGEVIANAGKTQIRIAETEKYPHVTFFFSGGREVPFEGEKRIMIPSPKVATYDLKPSMSARELTTAILPEIIAQSADFICLNFANTDMVGHTGVFEAAIEAAETVDDCTRQIVEQAQEKDYTILLIADHGNADMMINPDGSPNTAHSTNLVPVILVSKEANLKLQDGKLADIAPTILDLMEMDIPTSMDGKSLKITNT